MVPSTVLLCLCLLRAARGTAGVGSTPRMHVEAGASTAGAAMPSSTTTSCTTATAATTTTTTTTTALPTASRCNVLQNFSYSQQGFVGLGGYGSQIVVTQDGVCLLLGSTGPSRSGSGPGTVFALDISMGALAFTRASSDVWLNMVSLPPPAAEPPSPSRPAGCGPGTAGGGARRHYHYTTGFYSGSLTGSSGSVRLSVTGFNGTAAQTQWSTSLSDHVRGQIWSDGAADLIHVPRAGAAIVFLSKVSSESGHSKKAAVILVNGTTLWSGRVMERQEMYGAAPFYNSYSRVAGCAHSPLALVTVERHAGETH